MRHITPCLWFDGTAEDAVSLYTAAFGNVTITSTAHYSEVGAQASGMTAGSLMTVHFTLHDQQFLALNGGPQFRPTPAISFMVRCDTEEEIDTLWQKLSAGGKTLMELGAYPFAKRYGWLEDRFGVSWQLMQGDAQQKISSCLLFVGTLAGKATEAMRFYTSVFPHASINFSVPYEPAEGEPEGSVKHAVFTLNGQPFIAMDSSREHLFGFTPGVSLMLNCDNQEEIDAYWERLTAGGSPGQCGWLTDRYGVSWQIVPSILPQLLQRNAANVMRAVLSMTKIDVKKLEAAAK